MEKRISGNKYILSTKGIVHNSLVDATKDSIEDEDEVKRESGTETSLLFVYQSDWQKCLLSRYCNELRGGSRTAATSKMEYFVILDVAAVLDPLLELVVLDATYSTTQYALPLFFFVAKTNIDYPIAATFAY